MNEDEITTSNTPLASYLVAKKCPVIGILQNGKEVTFRFKRTPLALQCFEEFQYGDDRISARDYIAARTMIIRLVNERG